MKDRVLDVMLGIAATLPPAVVIESFAGQYRFLSNFWPAFVTYGGCVYPSVEHAYQAAKTNSVRHRLEILKVSAGEAKRLGRRVPMREDWESVKVNVMRDLLLQKFKHVDLRAQLLATGDVDLVEGNRWGDCFWGQCPVGVGENWLGRLLVQVRNELRALESVSR